MKNMKELKLILIFFIGLGLNGFSQNDEVEESGRNYGATPEDSIECIKNLSLYGEFYKQDNYKDALVGWRNAMNICPGSSKNLYVRGEKMFQEFIDKETDETRKEKLIDSLLWIYDMRMENFGERGYVLEKKGIALAKYRKDQPKEAFDILNESFELQKNETSAAGLVYLFVTKYYMVAKKMAPKSELIIIYPTLSDVAQYNIKNNPKYASGYEKASENLDNYFSKVAECPDLIELYKPKYEANPTDTNLIKQMLVLLERRGCTEDELYLNGAVALNKVKPTATSSYNIGVGLYKKDRYTESISFFEKTIELSSDNDQKYNAYINMAQAQLISKKFQAVKNSALGAAKIKPNAGEPYLLIGDAYLFGAKDCIDNSCEGKAGAWAAYDKYAKAKSLDNSLAEICDKKMATARTQFPKKADCFFYNIIDGAEYKIECWVNETTTVRVID